ncbi:hypothetical protein HRE53_32930 (plasmid) [Acaryochloris sp. 'Moss Beach']|uniref:two-partner secretion domain-containing protein n=1 Tax=Acaryochloris sp. 'Moss Beach' TaxID=2740837 RepID=UPI001F198F0A|nr:hypothetical protein [Acaryochloris sp. 'Moss Beach']UJB73360.1 hypothetical protein HRE53_32930 [Acaryochloris sp. 'Moss Beach']
MREQQTCFLLNKNGFIFGPNSALNLQGSLTISTAERLTFSDGFNYYTNRINQNISTRGIPSQLTLTPQSKGITLNGVGHGLSFIPVEGDVSTPTIISGAGRSLNGFKLSPSQTISLISNGIYLDGGLITSPSGDIFIASISEGLVDIDSSKSGISYTNPINNKFSDIILNNKSLLDTSGTASSRISLYGESINLNNASYILNQSTNTIKSSKIEVFADQKLTIEGTTNPSLFVPFNIPENVQSSIFVQDFSGTGTNININAKNIELKNGGTIEALSFGTGFSGNINVNALNSLRINGDSPLEPLQAVSIIITANFNFAKAGSVVVNAKQLSIEEAGAINSGTFSTQPGGDVKVLVENKLTLDGFSPVTLTPSLISSSTFRNSNAGNVDIKAREFFITNGGVVSTSTLASGDSGNISISSENIVIDGQINSPLISDQPIIAITGITASGIPSTALFQAFFNTPPFPSGDSGNISIISDNIVISNNANVGAENGGSGNAGSIFFRAKNLLLSRNGVVSARTNEGNGGNIDISATSVILNEGTLSASALGAGSGGNIFISADLLTSFGESLISANAVNSRGGNITFNTIGSFSSPETTITATSALGPQFSGTVTFSNPDTDLELSKVTLETEVSKPEVSSICRPTSNSASEFIVSGEGGLPTGPSDSLSENSGWHDAVGGSEQANADNAQTPDLVDAQGWVKHSDGTFSLVASTNLPINTTETSTPCNAQVQNTDSTLSDPSASLRTNALSTRSHSTPANPSPALAAR